MISLYTCKNIAQFVMYEKLAKTLIKKRIKENMFDDHNTF